MLNSVLWSDYIKIVFISCLLWYLFVFGYLYRQEWKLLQKGEIKLISKKLRSKLSFFKRGPGTSNVPLKDKQLTEEHLKEDSVVLFPLLLEAIKESKALGRDKTTFGNYISLILKDYPELRNSPYRYSTNKFLVSHLMDSPQLLLTLVEVDALWGEAN